MTRVQCPRNDLTHCRTTNDNESIVCITLSEKCSTFSSTIRLKNSSFFYRQRARRTMSNQLQVHVLRLTQFTADKRLVVTISLWVWTILIAQVSFSATKWSRASNGSTKSSKMLHTSQFWTLSTDTTATTASMVVSFWRQHFIKPARNFNYFEKTVQLMADKPVNFVITTRFSSAPGCKWTLNHSRNLLCSYF